MEIILIFNCFMICCLATTTVSNVRIYSRLSSVTAFNCSIHTLGIVWFSAWAVPMNSDLTLIPLNPRLRSLAPFNFRLRFFSGIAPRMVSSLVIFIRVIPAIGVLLDLRILYTFKTPSISELIKFDGSRPKRSLSMAC